MESTHPPDEGRLQAYLDGELPESERSSVEAHVRSCPECARALAELRSAAAALRAFVDRTTPDKVIEPSVPHPAFLRRRARPRLGVLARAAGLVLLLAGSAAVLEATTGWIGAAIRAVRGVTEAPALPAGPDAGASASADAVFTVQPHGGTLEVILDDLARGTRVTVHLGDGEVGEVRIGGGAQGVTYRAGPGSATAVAPAVTEVEVVLPRALRSGRVVVNGATVVVKAADRLFTLRRAEEIEGGFRFQAGD